MTTSSLVKENIMENNERLCTCAPEEISQQDLLNLVEMFKLTDAYTLKETCIRMVKEKSPNWDETLRDVSELTHMTMENEHKKVLQDAIDGKFVNNKNE